MPSWSRVSSMPKRKKKNSKTRIIVIVLALAVIAVVVIAWHDGLIGVTPIGDINSGQLATGTDVAIKGELTIIFGTLLTVNDGTGFAVFEWTGTIPPLHSTVVVQGRVSSVVTLNHVSAVRQVLLFS